MQRRHDILGPIKCRTCRQIGPLDHDHRQAQFSCRDQLGARTRAPGILGNDMGDTVTDHQIKILFDAERSARNHDIGLRKRQSVPGHVHQPQKVTVRIIGEGGQILPSDCQENPRPGIRQGGGGTREAGDIMPSIPCFGPPCGPRQPQQRNRGSLAGQKGVMADLRGKRVGRIHHLPDIRLDQIAGQPVHAAEPANALRQWLGTRGFGATGIGKYRIHLCIRQQPRKAAGFGGAAQQKDSRHD